MNTLGHLYSVYPEYKRIMNVDSILIVTAMYTFCHHKCVYPGYIRYNEYIEYIDR